jgi:hypothetical protein
VVFATVLLSGTGTAGCVRDAETEAVRVLSEQALEESGLASARRARDDDGTVVCMAGSVNEGSRSRCEWVLIYQRKSLWLVGDRERL